MKQSLRLWPQESAFWSLLYPSLPTQIPPTPQENIKHRVCRLKKWNRITNVLLHTPNPAQGTSDCPPSMTTFAWFSFFSYFFPPHFWRVKWTQIFSLLASSKCSHRYLCTAKKQTLTKHIFTATLTFPWEMSISFKHVPWRILPPVGFCRMEVKF